MEELATKRTRCEVWTRVMGYHRPVQNFNFGKKSEHYSRAHFSEKNTANSKFCDNFVSN
ncbi:MAG: anaerobic ribonucleoside-triphosphate reductase [Candidatus Gracilibacteria bacterium]|nr:anaerobic ribonucleoside-triphosphate reductase [Candidatus Gracilibacteria bacterium]